MKDKLIDQQMYRQMYRQKYLKYKKKYLRLLRQAGGAGRIPELVSKRTDVVNNMVEDLMQQSRHNGEERIIAVAEKMKGSKIVPIHPETVSDEIVSYLTQHEILQEDWWDPEYPDVPHPILQKIEEWESSVEHERSDTGEVEYGSKEFVELDFLRELEEYVSFRHLVVKILAEIIRHN